jgi:hypothetical protein
VLRKEGFEDYSTAIRIISQQDRLVQTKLTPQSQANPFGELNVLVKPFGSIHIDGKLHQANSDVLYSSYQLAGTCRLTVIHPRYGKWEKSITIEAGKPRNITIDFNRKVIVTVTSTPVWGDIYVDDQATGQQTPQQLPLRIGQHKIEVRRAGFSTAGGAKLVQLDDDLKVEFVLQKNP